LGPVSSRVR